jgi:hypothetical protein
MAYAAGAKVKVGGKNAEVVTHEDGVVHVLLDGEVVSVSPDQIDGSELGTATPPVNEGAPAADPASGNSQIVADLIAQLTARVEALETDTQVLLSGLRDLQTRMVALEARIPAEGGVVNPPAEPAPPADPAPPVQQGTHSTTDSTTAADAGASAAGS